jgi:hypothetical protein
VAEQALEKCKGDLTDAFICLLVDAEKREDKDKYKELYSSAKRRRMADINRIDQALSDLKSGGYTEAFFGNVRSGFDSRSQMVEEKCLRRFK